MKRREEQAAALKVPTPVLVGDLNQKKCVLLAPFGGVC